MSIKAPGAERPWMEPGSTVEVTAYVSPEVLWPGMLETWEGHWDTYGPGVQAWIDDAANRALICAMARNARANVEASSP